MIPKDKLTQTFWMEQWGFPSPFNKKKWEKQLKQMKKEDDEVGGILIPKDKKTQNIWIKKYGFPSPVNLGVWRKRAIYEAKEKRFQELLKDPKTLRKIAANLKVPIRGVIPKYAR